MGSPRWFQFRRWMQAIAIAQALASGAAAGPRALPELPIPQVFGVADGLPAAKVNMVAQDRSGYIWVATSDGLARFDGTRFRVWQYDPDDPNGLQGNVIQALHITADDRVVAAAEGGGLSVMEQTRSRFRTWHMRNTPTMTSDDVWAITSDRNGAIWFGTWAGGLYRLDLDDTLHAFRAQPNSKDGLPSDNIFALAFDGAERLWIGTDAGLAYWDGQHIERVVAPALGTQRIYSLFLDDDGTLGIGADSGFFRRTPTGQIEADPARAALGRNLVVDAVRDTQGERWLATIRALYRDDPAQGPVRLNLVPLPEQSNFSVYDALLDHQGGLWFGANIGLIHLAPGWRRFASPDTTLRERSRVDSDRVLAIAESADGSLWLGSRQAGLRRFDPALGRYVPTPTVPGLTDRAITALFERADGSLWLGRTGLLARIGRDGQTQRWTNTAAQDATLNGQIDLMTELRDGLLWTSSTGFGLQARDAQGHVVHSIAVGDGRGLEIGDTEQIGAGMDGGLWLAGGQGLLAWNAGERRLQPIAGVGAERVYGFALAADDRVWLARMGAIEVYRWDGAGLHRERRIDWRRGIPAVGPGGILVGTGGEVWLPTPRGLYRYSENTDALRRYGAGAGLPGHEFSNKPPLLSRNGIAVAAASAGLLLFDPHPDPTLDPPRTASNLVIDAISVRDDSGHRALAPGATLALGPADRDLSVRSRLLSYSDPRAHRYWFRLTPFDSDWVEVGNSGERNFPRLAAGDYLLEIRASDSWGNHSQTAGIAVRVAPHWWATRLARFVELLLTALALLGLALAWRSREQRRLAFQLAQEQRALAEKASRAKSHFLATMGHEIRTPMTGVLGMTELLLGTPLDDQQRRYASTIEEAGRHLLRLVDDALDLSRIEAGKLQLAPAPFATSTLFAQVQALLQPLAERKGLAFTFTLAANLPTYLLGDSGRIRQILLNLGNNAIKFTERGHIDIAIGWDAEALTMTIADTGPGLNEEQRARIFQRFEQAEGARTSARYGGSGLGLAICQELAAAMGGQIEVHSAPGRGSRFAVRLPLPKAAAPTNAQEAVALKAPGTLRLLLVEDDVTVAEVLRGLLVGMGHRVAHAGHGLAAMNELADAQFDAVLLDLDLPGLDGLSLARLILAHHPKLPLIAITARADSEAEPAARAAGMRAFLRKPVTTQQLAQTLAQVCAPERASNSD